MVERDLPKVDVEGSRPFSRSKIEDQVEDLVFYFTSDIRGSKNPRRGFDKIRSWTKSEERILELSRKR